MVVVDEESERRKKMRSSEKWGKKVKEEKESLGLW